MKTGTMSLFGVQRYEEILKQQFSAPQIWSKITQNDPI